MIRLSEPLLNEIIIINQQVRFTTRNSTLVEIKYISKIKFAFIILIFINSKLLIWFVNVDKNLSHLTKLYYLALMNCIYT